MTERLHFHFSLSCTVEGNGNPLWCSCLENPRDGGTWWASVYGVAQSWTQLKRLSSSSIILDTVGWPICGCFGSVAKPRLTHCDPTDCTTQVLCPPLALGVCSSSWPLSWWWCLTILSSAAPFSFGLQSFPASGSGKVSQLFLSGGQSIRASVSASVLPVNIKGW